MSKSTTSNTNKKTPPLLKDNPYLNIVCYGSLATHFIGICTLVFIGLEKASPMLQLLTMVPHSIWVISYIVIHKQDFSSFFDTTSNLNLATLQLYFYLWAYGIDSGYSGMISLLWAWPITEIIVFVINESLDFMRYNGINKDSLFQALINLLKSHLNLLIKTPHYLKSLIQKTLTQIKKIRTWKPHYLQSLLQKVKNNTYNIGKSYEHKLRQLFPGISMLPTIPTKTYRIPTFHKAIRKPNITPNQNTNTIYFPDYVNTKEQATIEKELENPSHNEFDEVKCPISLELIKIPVRLVGENPDPTKQLAESQVVCLESFADSRKVQTACTMLHGRQAINQKVISDALDDVKEALNFIIPKNRERIADCHIDTAFAKQYQIKLAIVCASKKLADNTELSEITHPCINYNINGLSADEADKITTQLAQEFPQWLCPLTDKLPTTPATIIYADTDTQAYQPVYEHKELIEYITENNKCPQGVPAGKIQVIIDTQTLSDIQHCSYLLGSNQTIPCTNLSDKQKASTVQRKPVSNKNIKPPTGHTHYHQPRKIAT